MPPRLGDTSSTGGAASHNASGAASTSSASPTPARSPAQQGQSQAPQPAPPRRPAPPPPSGRDEDDAVDTSGDDREGGGGGFARKGGGGGFARKRWDEFSKLAHGRYKFLASVNQVIRWDRGVSQTFKVLAPGSADHHDRQIEWAQSPPPGQSDGFNYYWRQRFIGAYAAGGWTVEPGVDGWDGWQPSSRMGKDGKPLPLPPYDRYFVVHADGLWIPTVLEVEVVVDAPPNDRYPKVVAVRPLVVDGRRVQAPMPWRVIDWIAESLGWYGTTEAVNKATKPVVKLDYKQVEQGAGGLMWWKDALRRIGELQGSPYAPTFIPAGDAPAKQPAENLPF